jgi:hypothetical protein
MRTAFAFTCLSLIAVPILARPLLEHSGSGSSALVARQISDTVINELYQRNGDMNLSQLLERRFV